MSGRATCVYHSLRNPLMVEVSDLLPQMKVVHQARPTRASLQGVIRVREPDALCGGQQRAGLQAALGRFNRAPHRLLCGYCGGRAHRVTERERGDVECRWLTT